MARPNIKKRPRGRPRTANNVRILPKCHKPLDMGAIARSFIELGLALAKNGKKPQKRAKNAGL